MTQDEETLWNDQGQRLYLTPEERERFNQAAKSQKDHQLQTVATGISFTASGFNIDHYLRAFLTSPSLVLGIPLVHFDTRSLQPN
jgi:hypothetical protein